MTERENPAGDRQPDLAEQGGNLPPIGDPAGEPDFGAENDEVTFEDQTPGVPAHEREIRSPRDKGGPGGMDMTGDPA